MWEELIKQTLFSCQLIVTKLLFLAKDRSVEGSFFSPSVVPGPAALGSPGNPSKCKFPGRSKATNQKQEGWGPGSLLKDVKAQVGLRTTALKRGGKRAAQGLYPKANWNRIRSQLGGAVCSEESVIHNQKIFVRVGPSTQASSPLVPKVTRLNPLLPVFPGPSVCRPSGEWHRLPSCPLSVDCSHPPLRIADTDRPRQRLATKRCSHYVAGEGREGLVLVLLTESPALLYLLNHGPHLVLPPGGNAHLCWHLQGESPFPAPLVPIGEKRPGRLCSCAPASHKVRPGLQVVLAQTRLLTPRHLHRQNAASFLAASTRALHSESQNFWFWQWFPTAS